MDLAPSAEAALAVAAEHQERQRRIREQTIAAIVAAWATLDAGNAVRSWVGGVGDRIFALIAVAQEQAASEAEAYARRALAAQRITIETPTMRPRSFAAVASDGRPLDSLLVAAPIRVAQQVRAGASPAQAMRAGEQRLRLIAETQILDAARAADSVVVATATATREPDVRTDTSTRSDASKAAARARAERIRAALATTTLSPEREADVARRLAKMNAAKPDPVVTAKNDDSPAMPVGHSIGVSVGYVRMINPPSCRDCVVLAGKWYRWNKGFERHPNCDCRHIPASESISSDLVVNPLSYFESLSEEEQNRYFGKNNATAIREGADISQVVNQTRAHGSVFVADDGRRYTKEGTSKRSLAQYQRKRLGLPAMKMRPTVWQIYRDAKGDREVAMRMLTDFGYILP